MATNKNRVKRLKAGGAAGCRVPTQNEIDAVTEEEAVEAYNQFKKELEETEDHTFDGMTEEEAISHYLELIK